MCPPSLDLVLVSKLSVPVVAYTGKAEHQSLFCLGFVTRPSKPLIEACRSSVDYVIGPESPHFTNSVVIMIEKEHRE